MMKATLKIALALIIVFAFTACNKNYYSGTGKGGKNCGCPSHKGMSGY